MKKLTAGIFAGILTIVTVSAADAAITSQAYVDGKFQTNANAISALSDKVGDETKGLTKQVADLNNVVNDETDGLKTQIAGLQETVEGLTNDEGAGSVANKIADALGDLGTNEDNEPVTVKDALDTKQNKSGAAYSMGGENGAWQVMTQAQQDALNSEITKTAVEQIGTNTTNIETINTKLGDIAEGKNVADMIAAVEEAAAGDVADKLGELKDAEGKAITVEDALKTKQDLLTATSIEGNSAAGNVISGIAAADGKITVTKTTVIPEVTDTEGTDGTWVLTAKKNGNTFVYAWEVISRDSTENSGEIQE